MSDVKHCRGCDETKSLDDFYWSDKERGYKASYCKECQKAKVRNHRIENPDRHKEYESRRNRVPEVMAQSRKKHLSKLRSSAIEALGGVCRLCGLDDVRVL